MTKSRKYDPNAQITITLDRLRSLEDRATMGMLVGGIAHEARNMMTSVLSFSQVGAQMQQDDERTQKMFLQIEEATLRCLDVFERVLETLREREKTDQFVVPVPVSTEDIVDKTIALIREQASIKRVGIDRQVSEVPPALGLNGPLVQVALNLAVNALHVTPEGGMICMGTERLDDGRVCIFVRDCGPGVPEELAEKIFEPLFTTKGDDGTGFGLSVSREYVERVGGELTLDPRLEGQGAVFRIKLRTAETEP